MTYRIAVVFCLALVTGSVQAAGQCRIGETIQQCWDHYLPSTAATTMSTGTHAKAAVAAADATKDKLERFETGLGGGAAELSTTTRNFLPLLAFSGLLADADGNSSDSLFTIDLNFLIPGFANDNNAQLKAILNTDPRLFGPTKEALDTANGDAVRSDALQGRLSASDDYTIAFTYSLINNKFGRSFEQYRYRFSNLFEAAITSAQSPTDPETALIRMGPLLQELGAAVDDQNSVIRDDRLLAAVEAAAEEEASLETRVRSAVANNHLSRFAELINNQPQLTFSFAARQRNELVGPKELAVKASYEFGLVNVDAFNRSSGRACNLLDGNVRSLSLESAEFCLDRYRSYIEDHDAQLQNADRFSVELAYVEVDDYAFVSVPDGVSVSRSGVHRLDAAVGYGRTLRVLSADYDSRLDVVAKYEDYSDDPSRRDRFVATATLTTQLSGISIPVVLVYANHDVYLPEVDKSLTAHVGLQYRFGTKTE